jgi:hypothetical protein
MPSSEILLLKLLLKALNNFTPVSLHSCISYRSFESLLDSRIKQMTHLPNIYPGVLQMQLLLQEFLSLLAHWGVSPARSSSGAVLPSP